MSFWRNLVGGQGGDQRNSDGLDVDDTVEKLAERVQTASLLEDRRDAVKALKSLAKKYRLEVGSRAMDILIDVIHKDRGSSAEITSMAVDCMSYVIGEDEDGPMVGEDGAMDELGERFSEIYIKKPENISLVLSLIEDYDFLIRRPALRFLTGLLRHCPHELQDKLLQDPAATSRLTDLLLETREFIRNDAVLMMCELTRGNAHIQKLVAYENAFQILLDIVFQEGDSIVVEDCLYVILNLLKHNPSNQQLFKEHSLIQRLAQLLRYYMHPENELALTNGHNGKDTEKENSAGWTPQRVANVHLLFQVIRTLVSPSSSEKMVQAAQKTMNSCGLLEELCDVLLAEGIPADVLTEAIMAVAEVIRGYHPNQEFFGSIVAPSEPPKSAVLVLLLSLTNDKQPFALRCSVLYCFQAYLHKNEKGKNKVVRTLLPSSTETMELTAGHVLCTGLLSTDPTLVWFSCVALMHCLLDTPSLKEQLLRVQLATSLGEAPVSLLQQICSVLCQQGSRKPQMASGILMLLGVWLQQCPVAVSHFLHRDENIAYLTTQAGGSSGSEANEQQEAVLQGLCAFVLGICLYYNDDSAEKCNRSALSQIYERRVGKDVIAERLEVVSRSELYVRAAQRTHPVGKNASELILDHEFTKVFKSLEGDLEKLLRPAGGGSMSNGPVALPHTVEQHENIVQSYKELIKRQDAQITDLTQQVKRLHAEIEQEKSKNLHAEAEQSSQMVNASSELEQLREELTKKCRVIEEKDQELQSARLNVSSDGRIETSLAENAQLKSQLENLNILVQQKHAEAAACQNYGNQWQAYQIGQTPDPNQVLGTMQNQFAEMEQQLAYGWQAFEQQSHQLAAAVGEKSAAEEKLRTTENERDEARARVESEKLKMDTQHQADIKSLRQESEKILADSRETVVRLEKELAGMKKEQDDLLVLLADQDQKIQEYRKRLVHCGQPVSEDEDEEENEPEGFR